MNGKAIARMILGLGIGLIVGYLIGFALQSAGARFVVLSNPMLTAALCGLLGLLIGRYVSKQAQTHIAMPNLAVLETPEQYQDKVATIRRPMVIEFYTDWCGACKRVGPMLNELAAEYGDRVYFYRVNVDKAGPLAAQNSVDGVPTTVFYVRGSEVKRIVGATWKEEMQRELDILLGG